MDRLRGLGALLVFAALFFLALRALHLLAPAVYPEVLSGPFSLDDIGAVEAHTGFDPLVPFYRPAELGRAPILITARRHPAEAAIFWQGEHFLYIEEATGAPPRAPAGVETRPLPSAPDTTWWREGETQHVLLVRNDLAITLRTDLGQRDLERIVDSLRPYHELL